MKSIRLLPIVIFAALALLAFKGIGLVTNGGYVLLGTETALAEGGGGDRAASAGEGGTAVPTEPTMTDSSPTMNDAAPTLPIKQSGAEAKSTTGEHTAPAAGAAEAGAAAPAGDGPVFKDGAGEPVSMGTGGSASEGAMLERLGDRRTQLDGREQELDMRMALVEAAEKRLAERTAVLEGLEARINALLDQNKVAEEEQLKSVVSLYETMKPKDAAAIFNVLDMSTLLRVARGMNPRKLAPIMAKMDAIKAKDLTTNMAVDQAEPTIEVTSEDLAALPQIVGQ